jgi:hypothetical protein
MIAEAAFAPVPKLEPATSSPRARKVYLDEYVAIETKLRGRDLEYGDALRAYLDAGLVTGLRPHEWFRTRLLRTDTCAALVVANAKEGNGRAHGHFRRQLWLLPAFAREVNMIERQISIVRARLAGVPRSARAEAMDVFNRALEDTLRQVQKEIWGDQSPNIGLYSTRHEFTSRAKARLNEFELAAVLGHGSNATARRHYAQPARGSRERPNFGLPIAHHRDVKNVRARLKDWRALLNVDGGPRVAP